MGQPSSHASCRGLMQWLVWRNAPVSPLTPCYCMMQGLTLQMCHGERQLRAIRAERNRKPIHCALGACRCMLPVRHGMQGQLSDPRALPGMCGMHTSNMAALNFALVPLQIRDLSLYKSEIMKSGFRMKWGLPSPRLIGQ